jgi:hypothetical protein
MLNKLVQLEPATSFHPELLGQLAAIGIVKGKPFNPDAGMRKILTDAAAVGNAAGRAFNWRSAEGRFSDAVASKTRDYLTFQASMAFNKAMMSLVGFLRFVPSSRFYAKESQRLVDISSACVLARQLLEERYCQKLCTGSRRTLG